MFLKIYHSSILKEMLSALIVAILIIATVYLCLVGFSETLDEIDKRVWLQEKFKQEAINGRK